LGREPLQELAEHYIFQSEAGASGSATPGAQAGKVSGVSSPPASATPAAPSTAPARGADVGTSVSEPSLLAAAFAEPELDETWRTVCNLNNDAIDMIVTARTSNVRLAVASGKGITEIDPDVPAAEVSKGGAVRLVRQVGSVRRLCAHPRHDVYTSVGHDQEAMLWTFGIDQQTGSYALTKNSSGSKASHTAFDLFGSKFGFAEQDGLLSLWHFSQQSRGTPFRQLTTELKRLEYFEFLSSSVLALAGQPSARHAVEVWDTLLPTQKAVVQRFEGVDAAAKCLLYLPDVQQVGVQPQAGAAWADALGCLGRPEAGGAGKRLKGELVCLLFCPLPIVPATWCNTGWMR
jgi:hypothetical protein